MSKNFTVTNPLITQRREIDRLHGEQDGIAESRRNRAILKRWSNRQLQPAFLRWVENFAEIRRQVGIINRIVRRWTGRTCALAWEQWREALVKNRKHAAILKRWKNRGLMPAWYKWLVRFSFQSSTKWSSTTWVLQGHLHE